MLSDVAKFGSSGRVPGPKADGPPETGVSAACLLAQVALIVLLVVSPWLFGGVGANVQVWLSVGVLAALACWLVAASSGRAGGSELPVALVPLILALGLGLFQLVPLERDAIARLSPAAAELRSALEPAEQSPDAFIGEQVGMRTAAQGQSLSLYPASTRRDLALLVLAVSVFVLGGLVFRTPRSQLWLCGAVAVNGAAVALFGLVQKLSWNGLLYWTVPLRQLGSPFGPFVNKNNAGGYLLLCLAGAAGITVWMFGGPRSAGSAPAAGLPAARRRAGVAWLWQVRLRLLGFLAGLSGRKIAAWSLAGCIVAGILCSLSRSAAVATVGAFVVTAPAALLARRPAGWLPWLAAAAVAGVALVGWVGMSDSVEARFATLLDASTFSENRILHWRDGLEAAGDFWLVGSGLGTYRYVYRPYQQHLDELWYYHAENQYLEALVETGVVGLGLMLAAIGLVGWACWRLLRDDPDPKAQAFAVAGIFALAGQAIHGLFDFALYIPANMILFALVCGAVSGRAAELGRRGQLPRPLALPRLLPPPALLAVLLLAAGMLGVWETRRVAAVEAALKTADFKDRPKPVSSEELTEAVARLRHAVASREDDVLAQHALGTLQLHQLVRDHNWAEPERLRNEPLVRDHFTRVLGHLELARRACPLYPGVHMKLAELSLLAGGPHEDEIHLRRAERLAPSDPDLLFRCGLLHLQSGRDESAWDCWRRSLALTDRHVDDVLRLAAGRLSPAEIGEKVLPDLPEYRALLEQINHAPVGRYTSLE